MEFKNNNNNNRFISHIKCIQLIYYYKTRYNLIIIITQSIALPCIYLGVAR